MPRQRALAPRRWYVSLHYDIVLLFNTTRFLITPSLRTEHYSVGQYDENGEGPNGGRGLEPASEDHDSFHDGHSINETKADDTRRELASGGDYDDHEIRGGFRCHHFDAADEKHTKPYEWKHCKDMEVGETYEVHWPHSAAGACGTVNQVRFLIL